MFNRNYGRLYQPKSRVTRVLTNSPAVDALPPYPKTLMTKPTTPPLCSGGRLGSPLVNKRSDTLASSR
eukprot:1191261-Prorocentrum_minimum.AAC.1